MNTKTLVKIAFYATLIIILEYIEKLLPHMLNGGSILITLIPIIVASYDLKWAKTMVVIIVYQILQWLFFPPHFISFIQYFMDYGLATMVFAFVGIVPKQWSFMGIISAFILRLIIATIAGMLFWQTPLWASLGYNLTYLLPSAIIVTLASHFILPKVSAYFSK